LTTWSGEIDDPLTSASIGWNNIAFLVGHKGNPVSSIRQAGSQSSRAVSTRESATQDDDGKGIIWFG
jgi:hypothetical protein